MAEKKEYIERSEVIRTILGQPPEHYPELYYRDIKELPAADVLEVVHGEWKLGKSGVVYLCSCCGYAAYPREEEEWNYCPCCGAKMDGGKHDG